MTYIESEIRWGTGYDNALSFAYPATLDDVRTYRKPAPGSRRTRNAAGTTDSWINRRDFVLAGRIRHKSPSAWGGSGVQDFLDWAGEGNAFRLIPNAAYPNHYIPDCYLDSPFDDPAPDLEEADGWQSISIVVRQQAYDFNVAQRGLMFEYVPGKSLTDPSSMLATYARAGVGYRVTRDLDLESTASGTIRDRHFIGSTRTTLLEQSRDNLVVQSDALATGWTATGTVVATDAVGTYAGRPFSRIAGGDGGVLYRVVTLPGNGSKGVSCLIKQDGSNSGFSFIALYDDSAGVYRCHIKYTVSAAGVVTAEVQGGIGSLRQVEALGDGVYRIWASAAGTIAANTNRIYANDDVSSTLTSVLMSGVQVEDAQGPSSLIPTTTVAVTRAGDSLSFPFVPQPQEMTVYIKFIEQGSILTADARILQIGKSDNTAPQLLVYRSTRYAVDHVVGSTTVSAQAAATPSVGDTVELSVVLGATGTVTLSQSINTGATATTSTSGANPLGAAWSDDLLWLNSVGSTGVGTTAFVAVRVAAGTRTLSEMRTI